MRLIFLGPPGSGKGTQAKMLSEKLKVPHISVGDILREEIRQDSEIGRQAKELMNAGRLVPDELTIELTKKRISEEDCRNGFIIDGFPRSFAQAEALDKMFQEKGLTLDRVIYFRISEEEAVKRLSGRRSCKNCGAVYHLGSKPPKKTGRCDLCGGELYQRPDDKEDVIRTRFEVYESSTRPLIERYKKTGKLLEIDAAKSIKEISRELSKI